MASDDILKGKKILIVDDGSTDGTREFVAGLSRKHPQLSYIRQENQGPSSARNLGIRTARNPIIAFLDSDDRWLPRHIEEVASCFSLFNKVGFVFAGYEVVDRDGQLSKDEVSKKYQRRDYASQSTTFMVFISGLYLDVGVETFGFEGYETGQSSVWHYPIEVIEDWCSD